MAARSPRNISRCYIDACVYIEVIKGKVNLALDQPEHFDNCLQLIGQLERLEIEVYASTLVYVEVFYRGEVRLVNKAKGGQLASPYFRDQASALIDAWFRQKKVRWVEVHLDLVEDARALALRIGCQSQDAVHLQTAIDSQCATFYTLDLELIDQVKASGGIPGLELIIPDGVGQQVII